MNKNEKHNGDEQEDVSSLMNAGTSGDHTQTDQVQTDQGEPSAVRQQETASLDTLNQTINDLEQTKAQLEKQLAEQQKLSADHLDGWRRLQAEFDNFRKREERLRTQLEADVKIKLMKEFLSVVDSFERAIEATEIGNNQADGIVKGVRLVFNQMESVLSKWNLKRIEAAGKPFDPNMHEAISKMPHPEIQEDHVTTVVQNGWQLDDKVVRPATVIISDGTNEAINENNNAAEGHEAVTSAEKED